MARFLSGSGCLDFNRFISAGFPEAGKAGTSVLLRAGVATGLARSLFFFASSSSFGVALHQKQFEHQFEDALKNPETSIFFHTEWFSRECCFIGSSCKDAAKDPVGSHHHDCFPHHHLHQPHPNLPKRGWAWQNW